nr:ribonuclease H-like domain-containing protein [Micromonospora sp. DSM 115978]
ARQDATRTADDRTGTVTVRVVAPDGLASLPPPDPGDVYFDMEGDPYAVDAAGLEYLFGAVTLDDPRATEAFHAFWAHDRPGEKAAFERFVDWTTARLADRPKAHVYHYAPYEPNALKRLAARHGTRESQVDELLRRLDAMIGLGEVKREVADLVDLIASAKARIKAGLPAPAMARHLVFAGPPGTGTTTVARLYG